MATPAEIAEEALYVRVVAATRVNGSASILLLQQQVHCSYNGAIAFLERMNREGVVGKPGEDGLWRVAAPSALEPESDD